MVEIRVELNHFLQGEFLQKSPDMQRSNFPNVQPLSVSDVEINCMQQKGLEVDEVHVTVVHAEYMADVVGNHRADRPKEVSN